MSRVFMITVPSANNSVLDLKPAEKFGEIVYLHDVTAVRPSIWDTERYAEFVTDRLEELDFNYKTDYFCLAGQLIYLSVVQSVLHELYGPINFLLWDASSRAYESRVLGRELAFIDD